MEISIFPPFRGITYLLSIQIMFKALKLYVPCCHTEKRAKLGLLQLVEKLCLLLKVSNPCMKRLTGSNSGELDISLMLNITLWYLTKCSRTLLSRRVFSVCSMQPTVHSFIEASWLQCGLWSQVARL